MKLTIDNLKEMGAFSGAHMEERSIKWKQGDENHEATVYVRPLSYHAAMSEFSAMRAGSDAGSGRIAYCICDEDGKPIFKPGDITGEADPERGPLNHELTMELLRVISDVSGLESARRRRADSHR